MGVNNRIINVVPSWVNSFLLFDRLINILCLLIEYYYRIMLFRINRFLGIQFNTPPRFIKKNSKEIGGSLLSSSNKLFK